VKKVIRSACCIFFKFFIYIYISGYEIEDAYVQEEIEEPSMLTLEKPKKEDQKDQGNLPGFRAASNSDYKMER